MKAVVAGSRTIQFIMLSPPSQDFVRRLRTICGDLLRLWRSPDSLVLKPQQKKLSNRKARSSFRRGNPFLLVDRVEGIMRVFRVD